MSASKLIRNTSGSPLTVTVGGQDYVFPGGGDTTMVAGHVADFVEANHFRDGLQIVHPEYEAEERERSQALVEQLTAVVEASATPKTAEIAPGPAVVVSTVPAPEPPKPAKKSAPVRSPRKPAPKRR